MTIYISPWEGPATAQPSVEAVAQAIYDEVSDLDWGNAHDAAVAVLALLSGRTEAVVKAEALLEAAQVIEATCIGFGPRWAVEWLTARAAQTEAAGQEEER